jgi:hypothetical protein
MTISDQYKGVECAITWADSPDGFQDVYISFEPEEFDTPSDLKTFYYFNDDEAKGLLNAIANSHDFYSINKEWFIDLTEDCELVGQS